MNPPHPDDVAAVHNLIGALKRARERRGVSQATLAEHVGLSKEHVGDLERNPTLQMRMGTVWRIAVGVGVVVTYRLDGLVDPPQETALSASMWAMWEQTGDPSYLAGRLMARIAAARRWLGLDVRHVGRSMGASDSYVYLIERPKGDVEIGTALGLCRALGGRLAIDVTDA